MDSKKIFAVVIFLSVLFSVGIFFIKKDIESKEITLQNLQEQKISLETESQRLTDDLKGVLDKAKETENENIRLKTHNNDLTEINDKLEKQIYVSFEEIGATKDNLDKRTTEATKLEAENNALKADNRVMKEKIATTIDHTEVFAVNWFEVEFNTSLMLGLETFEATVTEDEYYYYLSIEKWNEIINNDKTNELRFLADKRDCDNFSDIIKGNVSEIYGINSIGIVNGDLIDSATGEIVGGHAMNIFLAKVGDNDYPSVFFLEPQTDEVTEISEKIEMKGVISTNQGITEITNPIFKPYEVVWN